MKPCQRFCYTVQNQCPFFRPVDMYGGQPVFHCRNVVQVNEWRPDGYEDDDENYVDDNPNDEDTCYAQCPSVETPPANIEFARIPIDLAKIFDRNRIGVDANATLLADHYPGRFDAASECLFNVRVGASPATSRFHHPHRIHSFLLLLFFTLFYSLF